MSQKSMGEKQNKRNLQLEKGKEIEKGEDNVSYAESWTQ